MMTLALTYRNRDLQIVKNCLDSLYNQSNKSFRVILVDYGSEDIYADSLIELVANFHFVQLFSYPVKNQIWNKSRAVNIALQNCTSDYFFVGDIDMIFHGNFVEKLFQLKSETEITYLQVGFLDKEESRKIKSFEDYKISFLSSDEATGMTLYPTILLKSINGYDEFYHGWGGEDTDVHIRLQNKKVKVNFYDKEILILHQWHSKSYRTSFSKGPFHTHLEGINHKYIEQTKMGKVVKANNHFSWGVMPIVKDYLDLKHSDYTFSITNDKNDLEAFLSGTLFNLKDVTINVNVVKHSSYKSFKNKMKKIVGKTHFEFYTFDEINDAILLTIISYFRNQPYQYEYSTINQTINFKIKL